MHKYPILTNVDTNDAPLGLPPKNMHSKIVNINTGSPIHPDIIPYLDGLHHYDEICTALGCSPQELDEQLQASNTGNSNSFESDLLKQAENKRLDGVYGNTTAYEHLNVHQHSLPAQKSRLEDDDLVLFTNRKHWSVKFIYR